MKTQSALLLGLAFLTTTLVSCREKGKSQSVGALQQQEDQAGGEESGTSVQTSAEAATRLIDAMDSAKAVIDEFRSGGLSWAESERRLSQIQREAKPLWPRYYELSAKAMEADGDPDLLQALGEQSRQARMDLEMKAASSKSVLVMILHEDRSGGDKLPAKMKEALIVIADSPIR